MLRLRSTRLSGPTRDGLRALQQAIDALPTYEARVDAAKREFGRRNTSANPIFREVRTALETMAGPVKRCAYCEDSVGNQVEHIRPKNLYPEAVFVWTNYLYACGPCNGPKNDGFAILRRMGGRTVPVSVARKRTDPLVPPRRGTHALLNPRREDPLSYLKLDLIDTFYLTPVGEDGSASRARGEFTAELLRLNSRDNLPRARRAHYRAYLALLEQHVTRKRRDPSDPRLRETAAYVAELPHRTVWAEMQRQHAQIPELKMLFQEAPEALTW
jgi:uncharacterized protein (TIGR02646 family)